MFHSFDTEDTHWNRTIKEWKYTGDAYKEVARAAYTVWAICCQIDVLHTELGWTSTVEKLNCQNVTGLIPCLTLPCSIVQNKPDSVSLLYDLNFFDRFVLRWMDVAVLISGGYFIVRWGTWRSCFFQLVLSTRQGMLRFCLLLLSPLTTGRSKVPAHSLVLNEYRDTEIQREVKQPSSG